VLSRASRLAGCDLIMRMMFARTWTTNRDAIVGKLQDPKSRHSYLKKNNKKEKSLPYAFSQHHPASRARAHGTHTYTYVLRTILTRKTIHTKDYTHRAKEKEKHYNTIFTKCVLPPVPF